MRATIAIHPSRARMNETHSSARTACGARRASDEESHPPRVLLAEDNLEMRRFLADCLRKDGYDVIETQTGMELLDALSTQLFHPASRPSIELVISDLRMPGLTGLEVLAGLRDSDWATPFILITAFGSDEVHREALREGAAAVFDKPFDVDDLRTAVVNLIGRARQ